MNWKPIMRLLCHQKEERCYKIGNEFLIVCARCLGIYIGFLFSMLTLILLYGFFKMNLNIVYVFLLFVPMAADGFSQAFGLRESKNWLRFITGYIAGFGTGCLLYALFSIAIFKSKQGILPTYESLIAAIIFLPIFLFLLEHYKNKENLFLKKFFNFVSVFSAVFLILGIIIFYALFLILQI